jgi:UrcA family protein
MNTINTTPRKNTLPVLLTSLATVCFSFTATISRAADSTPGYVPTAKMVQYGDLNLATSQGVERLYERIVSAAHEVCDAHGDRRVNNLVRAQICARQSMARAVAAARNPALTALYVAKTGQQVKGSTLARR